MDILQFRLLWRRHGNSFILVNQTDHNEWLYELRQWGKRGWWKLRWWLEWRLAWMCKWMYNRGSYWVYMYRRNSLSRWQLHLKLWILRLELYFSSIDSDKRKFWLIWANIITCFFSILSYLHRRIDIFKKCDYWSYISTFFSWGYYFYICWESPSRIDDGWKA